MNILYKDFKNEPILDFSKEENRKKVFEALNKIKKNLNREILPLISGSRAQSINPADPQEIIATVSECDEKLTQKALEEAEKKFYSWAHTPVKKRAAILKKTAQVLRNKKYDLIALEILECGKQWMEADGDICEAIDFLEFYAQEMEILEEPRKLGGEPGQNNLYVYKPKGVGVVISPWNFPIAIPVGMIAAALVTGNCVLFKPSGESSACAFEIVKAFEEAGLPQGVLQFLPGKGSVIGKYLAKHPKIHFIAFTGSKEVGLEIIEAAAQTQESQHHVKKVIAEMGGKNAVIVDADADLDEAITGVLQGAFGYQGQKCSATSRVIVLQDNYEKFIERLKEAALSIKIAQAEDPGSFVGPVISKKAQEKIKQYIEIGKKESTLLVEREVPQKGFFVSPTIFIDVKPNHTIAQEEIFGPVLAVMKAENFDEALKIANGTRFALTGAVFSRSPKNIEKAVKDFDVGNLYINQKSTGAQVARQPFGGFKLSGVGSKAGGPDYLLQFMNPKTITEKTMRQGFSPETI